MANEVEIKLRITESGIEVFDDAGKKMDAFDKSARRASGEDGGGGLKGFIKGMADAKAAYDIFSQAITQSAGLIDQVNQIGVVSLRAKAGYEALGGSADTIKRMQDATRGLVDDTLLYQDATHAMSSEAAKSADDLVKIAQIGATLGITFRGDAATGVMEFTRAIEGVGNVRALRGLGIDVTAVKARLEELKGTMSDQDAWRMAIFDVAGQNAEKLAGNLDSTGTAVERLKIKFDDFVEGQAENVATGLEAIVGWWTMLADNPSLTLTVTLNTANNAATSSLNNANDSLTDWLNSEARRLTGQPAKGEHTGEMFGPPKSLAPVTSSGNTALRWLNDAGQQQREDAYMQSILDAAMPNSPIQQRRRNTGLRERSAMGNDALRDEFVAPYEAAHKQATELATVKSILGDISGIAGDYHSKMMAVLAPLQEQQRILEKRKSIQSVSDAFGLQNDGLYSEIGSGMSEAIATRRERLAEELRRKIGTGGSTSYASVDEIKAYDEKAKAARDAYERSIGDATAEELYKGGDYKKSRMEAYDKSHARTRSSTLRKRKGKTYSKKDYERDLQQFDAEAKDAQDSYAIATGAATKESIRFNDQLQSSKKAYEDGKISLSQYKNELLLLGEAAKSGTTSMGDLAQIQRRINLDMRVGAKSDADKSLFDQYAGGVKTKGSATGAAGEKETGPFDAVVNSANKASAAAQEVGTKGAVAVGQLVIASVLAATSMGGLHGQADNALQTIVKLKTELNMLASLSITVNTTRQGSDNTTRPARGMR